MPPGSQVKVSKVSEVELAAFAPDSPGPGQTDALNP